MDAVKRYLQDFSNALMVNHTCRAALLRELEGDISERVERGESVQSVLSALGSAKALAGNTNQEFANQCHPGPSRARWIFLLAALLATAGNGVGHVFVFSFQAVFVPGIWGCFSLFLLMGWCRTGHRNRFAVPCALAAVGIWLWVGSLFAEIGTFQTIHMAFSLFFLRETFALAVSGAWVCLIALLFSIAGYFKY